MKGRYRFVVKGSLYALIEIAILISLVVWSWGLNDIKEVLGGAFIFAGMYLLFGSAIISGISYSYRDSSPPSISVLRVQNPYLITKAYSRTGDWGGERVITSHPEPSPVLYGYFVGIVLFLAGILLYMV